ncbi:MAG TPA: hypothetical protein VNS58_08930 [Puia sp.]|nr:hypothetical protein [Puia sp.]
MKERKQKEAESKKVIKSEEEKKIFDNKVKYVLFALILLGGLVSIKSLWERHPSDLAKPNSENQKQEKIDSIVKQLRSQEKKVSHLFLAKAFSPKCSFI